MRLKVETCSKQIIQSFSDMFLCNGKVCSKIFKFTAVKSLKVLKTNNSKS